MVQLDHGLIVRARELTTGPNIHRAKTLVFVYEQAVILHNRRWVGHAIYHHEHEDDLRWFVQMESAKRISAA